MELLQLKYFCDAAETQNFSDTAKRFGVPASGISQTVKRLENELDTELFLRSANKVMLSKQGKIFYEGVRKALQVLENTKKELKDSEGIVAGEIRISVLTNRRIVTKVIEYFKETYDNVKFIINHNPTNKKDDFDIIISDEEAEYQGYSRTLLKTEKILLAARKGSDIAEMKSLQPGVLNKQSFISMPEGSSLFRHTNRICSLEGFVPDITIQSDDPFYIRKYVELGLGVAFVPEFSWHGMFSDDVILIDIGDYKRNTYVYHNQERYKTKAVEIFLNMLLNYCQRSV